MSTQQQWLITVTVDGQNLGIFDKKTGGTSSAKGNKHRPGGMGVERSYITLPVYSDVKVTRVYERTRDHELVRTLIGKAGIVLASVVEQPLDANGAAFGSPITYQGRFLGVVQGDTDSTVETPRMFELDMETVTVG